MFYKKLTADQIGGLFSIILGVVALIESIRISSFRRTLLTGDHILPLICGIILIILGLSLTFFTKTKSFKVVFPAKKIQMKMGFTFLIMLGYIVLIQFVGYVISTLVSSFALVKVFSSYSLIKCGIAAVVLTTGLYFIFIYWLNMPLPEGILFY